MKMSTLTEIQLNTCLNSYFPSRW